MGVFIVGDSLDDCLPLVQEGLHVVSDICL